MRYPGRPVCVGFGLALLAAAAGCGDDTRPLDDASPPDGGPARDAGVAADATAPLSWVDFTITGCSEGPGGVDDAGTLEPCRGPAPLTLRFSAVAPAPIEVHQWRFGDPDAGAAVSGPTPEHTFALPGRYDVSLDVAGPGGTAGILAAGIVEAVPAPAASACAVDAQCATGECVCGDDQDCAAPLERGLCTQDCTADADCGDGNLCADLDPTGSGAGAAPWQRSLCLPSCAGGGGCPDGTTCQSLRGADGAWLQACFAPGVLGRIGEPCAAADGSLDDSLCASGECLAVGTRGLCSAACGAATCPEGTACATFDGGDPAPSCVAACTEVACDHDPAVSCQLPGDGFSLEPPEAAEHCAPLP